jgi:hypothetical protein
MINGRDRKWDGLIGGEVLSEVNNAFYQHDSTQLGLRSERAKQSDAV